MRQMGRPAGDHPQPDRRPDRAGIHLPLVVKLRSLIAATTLIVVAACSGGGTPAVAPPESRFEWRLPAGFPLPLTEPDNLQTPAQFALGRRLFYHPPPSGKWTQAIPRCPPPSRGFTDGRRPAV